MGDGATEGCGQVFSLFTLMRWVAGRNPQQYQEVFGLQLLLFSQRALRSTPALCTIASIGAARLNDVHQPHYKHITMGLLSPESLRYAGVAFIYGCLQLGVAQLLRLCHIHPIGGVGVFESFLKYLSLLLSYSAVLNVIIFIAFQVECGMRMIGKDKSTGRIPIYSQIVFAPFLLPTRAITYAYLNSKKDASPTQIMPGWWIGGCQANKYRKHWSGIVDLTNELPEACFSDHYHLVPCWDGNPPSAEQIEEAASFALNVHQTQKGGDVLIHCAYGKSRSAALMCACLCKAGLFDTWNDAFVNGLKPKRDKCYLRSSFQDSLNTWQQRYVLKNK